MIPLVTGATLAYWVSFAGRCFSGSNSRDRQALATDGKIHCFGHVVRVEPQDAGRGVAAKIERYEFLQASA